MAMPTQFQVAHAPVQGTMGGGTHLHAPQSIFQHLMGQSNPQNQPGNWGQTPQIPQMYMPWSVPNLQQSQLVKFTGEKQQLTPAVTNIHQKRKLDFPDATEFQQSKQFITEEKMAAHFGNMHISSSFTSPQIPTTAVSESPTAINSDIELNIDGTSAAVDDGKCPRLVMSEELKRLQQEPLLPASLLSKLDRPSMALVLWEPPSRHLRMISTRQSTSPTILSTYTNEEEENNNSNNNNNSIDNNNQQILNLNQSVELEPMDL